MKRLARSDDWPAARQWTVEWFRERYGDFKFKVGTDDDGYAVRLKFKYYYDFLQHPKVRCRSGQGAVMDDTVMGGCLSTASSAVSAAQPRRLSSLHLRGLVCRACGDTRAGSRLRRPRALPGRPAEVSEGHTW